MTLSEKFDKRCMNKAEWIRKHGVDAVTAYKVISGELTGERNTNGKTREVFMALLKDKFIDKLPAGLKDSKKAS